MEDHGPGQKIHQSSHKTDAAGKTPFQKPSIEQLRGEHQAHDGSPHQIIPHFYKGQQIGDQDHRVKQTIVREIVDILPAPDICRKLRKQIPRLIELLPEIIRNHAVLADPVHIGTEDPVPPHKKPAEEQTQRSQKKKRQHPSAFRSAPHTFTLHLPSPLHCPQVPKNLPDTPCFSRLSCSKITFFSSRLLSFKINTGLCFVSR